MEDHQVDNDLPNSGFMTVRIPGQLHPNKASV